MSDRLSAISKGGRQNPESVSVESDATGDKSTRIDFYHRKSFKIAIILLLYVGSYSVFSANGRYWGRPSGEFRWGSGLAATDLSLWCPAGMRWERRKSSYGDYIIDADAYGWFYLPLILADRKWVHPTAYYFASDDEVQ